MALFKRSTTSAPYEPTRTGPRTPGSYLFTLRSVPRHHDGIRNVLEANGVNVYFSEPLAYIHGKAVAMFRCEAARFNFLEPLGVWWNQTEMNDAFRFDIKLFFDNNDPVASLKEHTPKEIADLIEAGAPRTPENPLDFQRTPYTTPAARAAARGE